MSKPKFAFRNLVFLIIFSFCVAASVFSQVSPYENRSLDWLKRNGHLIPDEAEEEAILKLNQDYADSWRRKGDADGDGAVDFLDPSPNDWREIGYSPFGVLEFLSWNHSWNNYKYDRNGLGKMVKLLKEAGVSFVRFDFLWEDIEPQQGSYNFEKYDYLVNLLTENQIRILGVLSYSASWAGEDWNYPPYKNETFVNYVSMTVSRYKDKVKYWEIWNEPDFPVYWAVRDDMKGYTQLLKESYIAVKKCDPSAKVVLGGLTSDGYYALKNIYRNGGKDYFDIMNIHPFTNPLSGERLYRVKLLYKNIRKEMVKNGDGHKKIWFTELGCPGVKKPTQACGWWEGQSPNEKQQARWVKEIYSELIDLEDVEKIFWAFFRDNKEHFKNAVDYFGLVRWDYTKKLGFNVYKQRVNVWRKQKGNKSGQETSLE